MIAANGHPGPDTIVVPAGRYVLQQVGQEDEARAGDLDILDDLTILGEGASTTVIDGGGTDRVIEIHGTAVVRLSALTLQNGSVLDGGGVISNANRGVLTLEDCRVDNGSARVGGAILIGGQATVALDGCTLGGGIADAGGAIFNEGILTAETSTFSGNSSIYGGAINNTGTATLTGCTLTANSASDGGAIYNNGTLTLTSSIFTDNGGGVGSSDGGGIFNDASGMLTMEECTLNRNGGDMIRRVFRGGGLRNVGVATLSTSTLTTNTAFHGGAVDNEGTLTITTSVFDGNSARRDGAGGGIYNRGTGIILFEDSTLHGSSAPIGGAVYNEAGSTLTFVGSTLVENSSSNIGGGGLYNSGTATLINCVVDRNSATGVGGGAFSSHGSDLTIANCTFSGNAASDGGAIRAGVGSTVILRGSSLTNNSAHGGFHGGGGAINSTGTLVLESSTLSDNVSTKSGGALWTMGTATLLNCTLSNNTAEQGVGGAISNGEGGFGTPPTATITNCTLSGNSAPTGGGIYNGAAAILTNTIIANSPQGRTCAGQVGPSGLRSGGHNLDDDGGCGFFNAGDLSILPAHLVPLGQHGGPTDTHALCAAPGVPHPDCAGRSPAIDAGDDAHCPLTDQRGGLRPHGARCDIGAYESGAVILPRGDTNCDGLTSAADIPALVVLIATDSGGECDRSDLNGDDVVDSADMSSLLQLLFQE